MRSLLLLLALFCLSLPAAARLPGPVEQLAVATAPRDLAQIRDSGELRVLVNQSRNTYASVRGQPTGSENLRLAAFLEYLNLPRGGTTRPVKMSIIPMPKDQLLEAMQRGEGDLLVPGELLDISQTSGLIASEPILRQVAQVFVSRHGQPRYQRLEQLAGRMVVLPAGSAALPAIMRLNQQLRDKQLDPLMIEWADASLGPDDVLEMVAAGIYRLAVVDLPLAERWSKVLPGLRIDRQLVLDEKGDWVWVVKRDAPILLASVNFFLRNQEQSAALDSVFLRTYKRKPKVHDPLSAGNLRRLEKVRPVLQKHAAREGFDWLLLAAVAYKESGLNPAARGAHGATGLMQVTPGAARSVGVGNIQPLDNNVQAAARYLGKIRHNFFANPQIAERERLAFTLAAYNLGPQRVQAMRAEARRRGLNANQWFFQVERIAAEKLGLQPVSYVNSLNKYYQTFVDQRDFLEPR